MTLEQLRAASSAGGVTGITLKGQGGAFLVQIATRNGGSAMLTKARGNTPRRFGNPVVALTLLRGIGITTGQFDAAEWNPAQKEEVAGNRGRAEAMRKAHQAAAYAEWLGGEIKASIDDQRPNVLHDDVMAEMDAEIAALKTPGKRRKQKQPDID